MIHRVLRVLWRLIIFALGSLIIWVMVFRVAPYADTRLPTYIVLVLFYCFFAYGLVPFLIRVFRVFSKPDHIPLYVTTSDGWPSDPVNLAVVARNKAQLRKTMKAAGWYEAEPLTLVNGLREIISIVFRRPYPEAPVSTLYLFNRRHDIAFQLPTNPQLSARTRHHVRFWKLSEPPITHDDHQHFHFWQKQLKQFFGIKRSIWIGAATEEPRAIDLQWRTGQLTHGGSHDADAEREFIAASLKQTGLVRRVIETSKGEKLKFRGQQFRTIYTTDGSLKVIELKISSKTK